MLKKIFSFILLMTMVFIVKLDVVFAFEANLGTITQGGSYVKDEPSGYGMAVKVSSIYGASVCTEYKKTSPAGSDAVCTLTDDWTPQIRAGVAAVLRKASSNLSSTTTTNEYFAAELAINHFLHQKGVGGADISGAMNLSSTYSGLYNEYLTAANTAYNNYSEATLTLSTSNLTFTKQGDNYVSNSVTVTTNADSYNVTPNKGKATKNGNSFSITIPSTDIINGTNNISVSVSVSKTNYEARNYNCGGAYQTLTPNHVEPVPSTKTASLTGTIEKKTGISITKFDAAGNPLSGAKLQILDNSGNVLHEWVSTTKAYEIETIPAGTYTLKEIEAPEGYELLTDDIEFEVSSDGNVVMLNQNMTRIIGSELVVFNFAKTKLSISKQDITNGKELPGASLQILDSEGNEIKDADGKVLYKWVSTDTPYYIEGLPAGKYILVETIAPEGYALSKESIEFELTNDGLVKTVVMKNAPKVPVPSTGFNTSLFLLSVGLVAIVSGAIFVGLNVKKQNQ